MCFGCKGVWIWRFWKKDHQTLEGLETFWIGRKTFEFGSSLEIAPEIQELQEDITHD